MHVYISMRDSEAPRIEINGVNYANQIDRYDGVEVNLSDPDGPPKVTFTFRPNILELDLDPEVESTTKPWDANCGAEEDSAA